MFENILGKKKNLDLSTNVVNTMNLSEMKSYINNKELSEDGLVAVMKRLVLEDQNTQKLYLQIDDMDSKIKKAFELVLEVSTSKKITVVAIEMIQDFTNVYADIIKKYDNRNKDIYSTRLRNCISTATDRVNKITNIAKKLKTVNS